MAEAEVETGAASEAEEVIEEVSPAAAEVADLCGEEWEGKCQFAVFFFFSLFCKILIHTMIS